MSSSYNRAARAYTTSTFPYARFPGLREEVQEFVEELPVGPVLDVGCGSGRDGMLARALGRDVIFADAAFEMLRQVPSDMTVCCDVLSLPFPDEVFAGVIASGVLLHVPHASCSATLAELLRVTAGGGRISLSMKSGTGEGWRRTGEVPGLRWFTYYTEEEFTTLCTDAGFVVSRAWRSPREDWFTVVVTRSPHKRRQVTWSGGGRAAVSVDDPGVR